MSELGKTYKIRAGKESDKAFLMATWLRGLFYGNAFYSLVPKTIFMDNYKAYLEALIDTNVVEVACLIEDEDIILGYSVLTKDLSTVHWVFVKAAFRKQGIGKSLVPAEPTFFSHFSDMGLDLAKKFKDFKFNPFKVT